MANITVSVTDANNITVQLTPVASQTITIDRGVAGNGISSIVPVTISTLQYLRIFYTNGTQQDVGPLTSTAYAGVSPIDITGNTISLLTVPINKGGTNATTAAAAIENLLPSYTGNGSKRLSLNSGATALEWVLDGGGTVTSVDVSGGTTGLTTSGGPITGSGTITLAGTLGIANGGTNGIATPTAGAVPYGTGTAYAFTAAGTAGQILRSNGASAPTWANLSSLGVSSFSAGTTGFTPSTATTGAVTLAGTLATTNGGTGLTSFTANGIVYASSTSALTTGSALSFDTSRLVVTANNGTTIGSSFQQTLSSGVSAQRAELKLTDAVNASALISFLPAVTSTSSVLTIRSAGSAVIESAAGAYAMTFDASGNLGVGTNTPAAKLSFGSYIPSDGQTVHIYNSGNVRSGLGVVSGVYRVFTDSGSAISFGQVSTSDGSTYNERARISAAGVFSTTLGATIQGLTVGLGAGAVSTNTAVGASALAANTSGAVNGAFGYQSLGSNTTGYDNNAFGYQALYANISGIENAGFGHYALKSNTTGGNNTGIGSQSLYSNTTASNNTAVGYQSAYSNTTGAYHTAVGYQSLKLNTTGANNTAFGNQSLYSNTTGNNNTAIGDNSLALNTTASNNTAVGYQAGYSNTTGTDLCAFGNIAAYSNTTGAYLNAFGRAALYSNTTGASNAAFGHATLYANTTGGYNTAIGSPESSGVATLRYNTTGNYNIAVGSGALGNNTTASNNTAVGYQSLYSNSTGDNNVAVGWKALLANTTGLANSAVGLAAMSTNTSGSYNVAFGQQALGLNTTASNNTAMGYQAGYSNTAGNGIFIGFQAGYNNVSGIGNLAIGIRALGWGGAGVTGGANNAVGDNALYSLTSGISNTAFGTQALYSNTTASNNTAIGYLAGYSNTTGVRNTYIGDSAGFSATTAEANTAVGKNAGHSLTSGSNNTLIGGRSNSGTNNGAGFSLTTGGYNNFFGGSAGSLVTTGSKNTILGNFDGNQGGLDIRTGGNYIVLSDGDGTPMIVTYTGATVALQGAGYPQTGTGIQFPATQNASSNANTLDDYEEGTWTPNVGGTATYTYQYGVYTKIGNLVYVKFILGISSIGTGSTATILGLPFTTNGSSSVENTGCIGYYASLTTAFTWVGCYAGGPSQSFITMIGNTAAATTISSNGGACFGNNSRVDGALVYQAN